MERQVITLVVILTGLFLLFLGDPVFAGENDEEPETIVDSEEVSDDEFGDMLDFDEDEMEFTEIDVDLEEVESSSKGESNIVFGGFFREEIDYSYSYEDPDFSKIKSTLNLKLDIKLSPGWRVKIYGNSFYDYSYEHRGRDEFTDETLETYESESEFRDVNIDGDITDWLRIKLGRQFIVWGQSDSAQITDVANPRDIRELGMVDLEDARIPVGATKLSFILGSLELNAVAIHEIRVNKTASEGSEFDMYQELRKAGITIEEEETPQSNGENTEYLVRLFKTFNGGDFGVVWADLYDDAAYLEFEELSISPSSQETSLILKPKHKRVRIVGFSGVVVWDKWLFKTEIARWIDTAVSRGDIEDQLTEAYAAAVTTNTYNFDDDSGIIETWSEKDVLHGMLGVEYSGFDNITISFEAIGDQIEDHEENLYSEKVSGQLALMVTHKGFNDTLDTQFFWIHFTDNNGDLYRFNIGYDLKDYLNISGGWVTYEATDEEATMYNYRDNDRVFAALKYSF